MPEGLLSKQRILEIYPNSVEVGRGSVRVQGGGAVTTSTSMPTGSGTLQAARLAVMLPAPKALREAPGVAVHRDHRPLGDRRRGWRVNPP